MTRIDTIKTAITSLIAANSLVPTTTLSSAISAGAAALPVSSESGFVPGSLVRILDGVSDGPFLLDSVASGSLHLDAVASNPLRAAHAAGAQVIGNVTTGLPVEVIDMVSGSGWPVWSVNILDDTLGAGPFRNYTPQYLINIGHFLPINRGANSSLHVQLWTEQQEQRAEHDTAALIDAIKASDQDLTLGGAVTLVTQFSRSFRGEVASYRIPVWESWIQLKAQGDPV